MSCHSQNLKGEQKMTFPLKITADQVPILRKNVYLKKKKNQIHYAVSQSLIPKVQRFITILFFVVHIKVI